MYEIADKQAEIIISAYEQTVLDLPQGLTKEQQDSVVATLIQLSYEALIESTNAMGEQLKKQDISKDKLEEILNGKRK